ncbi:unnamed protein product [Toxocara canis]|uniref:Ground-like domain-containing protein n=1 Tax=Toxocara canis TaxID=6265 RepID=A0A183UYF5_TOXCA|nr:unnamed protein product [Toxocara canis]
MFSYLLLLAMLPVANSFLLGGGGCCCACGIPQPAFCGCRIQIACPVPVPCPVQSCPVCQTCPEPVQCPPPPVAVCPAPQPVYVQPACGGGGCGSFGGPSQSPSYVQPSQSSAYGGPGGGYTTSGGFGGSGGPYGGAGFGAPSGFGPQGFGPGGCTDQECRTRYIVRPAGGEGFSTVSSFSDSASYGPSFAGAPPGASGPLYTGSPFAPQVAPGATYSGSSSSPPSRITFSEGVGYSEGSSSSSGMFASGAAQQPVEPDLDNEPSRGAASEPTEEDRRKDAVEALRRARGVATARESKCNSEVLMKLIVKNIVAEDPVASKRAIHRAALRDINDAIVDIICSGAGFTYIVSTAEHCEAQRDKVICFAYKKP